MPSKRAVRRVLAIVLVALGAACDKQEDSPIKDIQNDPKFRYQNGLSALRAGNPDRAVRDLEVARTLEPKNVDVLHALGLALSESGNSSRAIEVLTEAIALSPKNPALLNSRGVVLSRARRFDEAIVDFQAALAPDAHYATPEAALLNLADAYTETQRFPEAIDTLEKGSALRPRSGAIETALCRTYDRAGRLDEAHRACQQSVLDEPTYAAGYFELGKIELRRGRNAEALSAFEKCLKLEPRGETAEQARRYRTLLAPDAPALPPSGGAAPNAAAAPEAGSPR